MTAPAHRHPAASASRRWAQRLLAAGLAAALAPAAMAMRILPQDVVCPLDGQTFRAQLAISGTAFGAYFDGQPYGAIAAPSPLPVCPGSGFVVEPGRDYRPDELERLRAYVATPEYRALVESDSAYYRLARQQARLGTPPEQYALILLQATWEASPAQYPRYAAEALDALAARAAAEPATAVHSRMLVGELQRRLGRFEPARATFQALQAQPGFPGVSVEAKTADYLRQVLAAQLRLIQARNSQPARLDEQGETIP